MIKGKRSKDREWLESKDCNSFLKKVQKNPNIKDMLIQRIAELYGLSMVQEEESSRLESDISQREKEIEQLTHKNVYYNDKLSLEEEAKRRTLLRYVHAVKAAASMGDGGDNREREEVGSPGAGRLQLPEAGLTDEEVHAIAAMLRGNTTIVELNLRGNLITDEGARAIAAVLNGRTALRTVDLRGNRVGRPGLRAIAEALERSERVRHVYVHAGGKIEALGTGAGGGAPKSHSDDLVGGGGDAGPMVTVETVCVVDIRENNPPEDILGNRIEVADKGGVRVDVGKASPFNPNLLPGVQGGGGGVNTSLDSAGSVAKGGTKESKSGGKHGSKSRKKSEERLARQERERKKQAKILQDRIDRENMVKEQGWAGRAGGQEVQSSVDVSNKRRGKIDNLPPVRTKSAEGGGMMSRTAGAGGRGGGGGGVSRNLSDNPLAKSAHR